MIIARLILVLVIASVTPAFASDFDEAISTLLPPGIRLGMTIDDLKQLKPGLVKGPEFLKNSPGELSNEGCLSFTETLGLGSPGMQSYWYLTAKNKLVGILRNESVVGMDLNSKKTKAQGLLDQLRGLLGPAKPETIVKTGEKGFVPVSANVWGTPSSDWMVYLVATDKEITIAAVRSSEFPKDRLLIRPDPEKFPLEDDNDRSILPRN